nr:hypothetical protein [Paenibacillus xylanexedens]
MATIGQPLLQPESGWKRYDNNYSAFEYSNSSWRSATENTSNYGVAGYYTSLDGAYIRFSFKGTKIRIIYRTYSDERTVNVSIDGVTETFEPKTYGNNYRILVYEKLGLTNQMHEVRITFVNNNTNSAGFDAIDIDEEGEIRNPYYKILLSSGKKYSLKDSTIFKMEAESENNFLNYGVDSIANFNGYSTKMRDIVNTVAALDLGKTYEHTIDMSKRRVNKIILGQ